MLTNIVCIQPLHWECSHLSSADYDYYCYYHQGLLFFFLHLFERCLFNDNSAFCSVPILISSGTIKRKKYIKIESNFLKQNIIFHIKLMSVLMCLLCFVFFQLYVVVLHLNSAQHWICVSVISILLDSKCVFFLSAFCSPFFLVPMVGNNNKQRIATEAHDSLWCIWTTCFAYNCLTITVQCVVIWKKAQRLSTKESLHITYNQFHQIKWILFLLFIHWPNAIRWRDAKQWQHRAGSGWGNGLQ